MFFADGVQCPLLSPHGSWRICLYFCFLLESLLLLSHKGFLCLLTQSHEYAGDPGEWPLHELHEPSWLSGSTHQQVLFLLPVPVWGGTAEALREPNKTTSSVCMCLKSQKNVSLLPLILSRCLKWIVCDRIPKWSWMFSDILDQNSWIFTRDHKARSKWPPFHFLTCLCNLWLWGAEA